MNLPAHITRRQLSDAFAAMGLHIGEVLGFAYDRRAAWLEVDFRGPDGQPVIDHISTKILIVDVAPEQPADLLGELKTPAV